MIGQWLHKNARLLIFAWPLKSASKALNFTFFHPVRFMIQINFQYLTMTKISEKNKNCRWAVYEKSIFVASKFLLEKIFYLKDDYVNKIWECNTTEYTI